MFLPKYIFKQLAYFKFPARQEGKHIWRIWMCTIFYSISKFIRVSLYDARSRGRKAREFRNTVKNRAHPSLPKSSKRNSIWTDMYHLYCCSWHLFTFSASSLFNQLVLWGPQKITALLLFLDKSSAKSSEVPVKNCLLFNDLQNLAPRANNSKSLE